MNSTALFLFSANLAQTGLSQASGGTAAQMPLAQRTIGNGLTWPEALQFLFVGLTIVFLTLAVLWGICELMGVIFRKLDAAKAARSAEEARLAAAKKTAEIADGGAGASKVLPAPAQTSSAAAVVEPIPPAVFVAAAQAVMGGTPHRIISVQKIDGNLPASAGDIPLAVIAAAVAEALNGVPHKILSVTPVDMAWAHEGRREQMRV